VEDADNLDALVVNSINHNIGQPWEYELACAWTFAARAAIGESLQIANAIVDSIYSSIAISRKARCR
jgi:hypothetical protein